MGNEVWNLVGFIASILSALTFIPELIKAYKTHHLQDLSWGMLILLLTSSVLWMAFGLNFSIVPLIFSSLINISCGLLLTSLKFKFARD
ncbi:hypothetical protein IT412_05890 [Candidatus Peregrinibacteria bacterium]|nr:hypothetical protein [Candidatus Peregrinibacteria bacterium]